MFIIVESWLVFRVLNMQSLNAWCVSHVPRRTASSSSKYHSIPRISSKPVRASPRPSLGRLEILFCKFAFLTEISYHVWLLFCNYYKTDYARLRILYIWSYMNVWKFHMFERYVKLMKLAKIAAGAWKT